MFNNGGHEHIIRNNIFALSANQAIWPYSEKRPCTFRHNIVYFTQGQLLVPYGEASLKERLAAHESPGDWDWNLYWRTDGPGSLRFYHRTFTEWKSIGLDAHSLVVDPQFTDPAKHDFRLRRGSPAFQLGFREFDFNQAGLYGDRDWVNEGRHRNCPLIPLPPPRS